MIDIEIILYRSFENKILNKGYLIRVWIKFKKKNDASSKVNNKRNRWYLDGTFLPHGFLRTVDVWKARSHLCDVME